MTSLFHRLTKKPFFGRFMVPWRNPIDYDFLWRKQVIDSPSGGKIMVWTQEAQRANKATIVLAHQMGKPAKGEFLKTGHAEFLLKNGYNVVVFDFNGFGESSMGSFYYHHDLEVVANYAKSLFPGVPLALHGVSFGANWGSVILGQENNPFQAAILESGATNLPAFWVHYPFAAKMLRFLYKIVPSYARYANFESAISHCYNCDEILFIAADPDKYTPVEMTEAMQAKANVFSKILVFHDAEHAQSISSEKERYLQSTLAFLDKQFLSVNTQGHQQLHQITAFSL